LKQCACHCTQDQVGRGAAATEAALAGALDAVRGAVLDAFPGGLPPWEPVRRGLEGDADGQARARCREEQASVQLSGAACIATARDAHM